MPEELTKAAIQNRAASVSTQAASLLEIAMDHEVQSRLRVIISDCGSAARAAETSARLAAVVLNDVERRLDDIDREISERGSNSWS